MTVQEQGQEGSHQENGLPHPTSNSLYTGIHQSVFMSGMMPTSGRDLPLCWEQHSLLLPGVKDYKSKDVTLWSTQQVAKFVATLPGCGEVSNIFLDQVCKHTEMLQCI